MKHLLPLFALTIFSIGLIAQPAAVIPPSDIKPNVIYRTEGILKVNEYTSLGACVTNGTLFTIPNKSKIRILKVTTDKAIFLLLKSSGGNAAENATEHETYCADLENLSMHLVETGNIALDYGALTIPFKFQFQNYLIHPGGALGGFIGPRFVPKKSKNSGFSLVGFGGLSSVPLNNAISTTDPTEIEVVPGLGLGIGLVTSIQNFQIGLFGGKDFFNSSGKKTNTWLSFSVGYTFLGKITANTP